MVRHTQFIASAHDRFMQAANEEFAKFERREAEFRQQDRNERAVQLGITLKTTTQGEPRFDQPRFDEPRFDDVRKFA